MGGFSCDGEGVPVISDSWSRCNVKSRIVVNYSYPPWN